MSIITSWELFLEKKKASPAQLAARAKFKEMIAGKKKKKDDEDPDCGCECDTKKDKKKKKDDE